MSGLERVQDGTKINLAHLSPTFLALHIAGGQVGLPILIATCVSSKNVLRHPTIVNFFCTWVIYSVSYCLLLYGGNVEDPHGSICFTQSVMVHGAPPMCAVATLIVVVQTWSMFHQPEQLLGVRQWSRSLGMMLKLALPYITFFVFVLITAVLQARFPQYVNASNGLYCTYYKDPFRRFGVSTFCILILLLILGFEIAIGIRYYRMWKQITTVFPLANRDGSPTFIFRIALFNLYGITALSAGVSFLSDKLKPWPFMVQAALPLAVVMVFGTQEDLALVWLFWKRKRKTSNSMTDDNIASSQSTFCT